MSSIDTRDYIKAICSEIDFMDISHLNNDETPIVDQLATEFKNELSKLNKSFMFNENDEIFIPLRTYFATALRYAIENTDPTKYNKYNILKKEVGLGLEVVFFNEIVLPGVADKVYDKFFIDFRHPLLYNSKDGRDNYSFTGVHGKYGMIQYGAKVDELAGIKPFYTEADMPEMDTFKPTWANDYMDRLPLIFSKITTEECKPLFDESLKEYFNG